VADGPGQLDDDAEACRAARVCLAGGAGGDRPQRLIGESAEQTVSAELQHIPPRQK